MLKFKGGLSFVVAAAAALCIAAPASAQQTRTLKMQSTWPASLTLQDNFRMFAERVDKLTSGSVKIEALAAGQIVPAFEILDATHKKVHRWRPRCRLLLDRQAQEPRRCSRQRLPARSAWTTWTSWAGCMKAAGWTCTGNSIATSSSSMSSRSRSAVRVRRRSDGSSGRSRISPTSKVSSAARPASSPKSIRRWACRPSTCRVAKSFRRRSAV